MDDQSKLTWQRFGWIGFAIAGAVTGLESNGYLPLGSLTGLTQAVGFGLAAIGWAGSRVRRR